MAVEYQILVAAREATSRDMVPEQYRHLTPVELSKRIEELRVWARHRTDGPGLSAVEIPAEVKKLFGG